MPKNRARYLGADWDVETICTPSGRPYCLQLYGWPVAPAQSRMNVWIPLQDLINLSDLSIPVAGSTLESVSPFVVPVSLFPADPARTVEVNYTTVNGTAIAGVHYVAVSGTAVFPPGTTIQSIPITILDNNEASPVSFQFVLSDPVNAEISSGSMSIEIIPDGGST